MKLLLPALLLLLAFTGCKKDHNAVHTTIDSTLTHTATQPVIAAIKSFSPTLVTAGTVATITGANFGTSASMVSVYFQNQLATVQSVTPTEIKVIVPETTSGTIAVEIGGVNVSNPSVLSYVYYDPSVAKPYVSGNVKLVSQADVDSFVKFNKGKQLQITGDLIIGLPAASATVYRSDISSVEALSGLITAVSGTISFSYTQISEAPFLNTITNAGAISIAQSDFSALHFSALQSFSGDISLVGLTKLTDLGFNKLLTVKNLTVTNCPLLTDLSCFGKIQSAASITFNNLAAVTDISMDDLRNVSTSGVTILVALKLAAVSFKSLSNLTGRLHIFYCQKLSAVNFNSLKLVSDRLTIDNTNLTDLTGFSAIQSLGALSIISNNALINLQGMEQLTRLTLPAINGDVHSGGGPSSIFSLGGLPGSLGGVTIQSNPRLTSLAGLQNIKIIPVVYIVNNNALTDFCPFKTSLTAVAALPNYNYTYVDTPAGMSYQRSTTALTLTNNGAYATTQNALDALKLCQ